jgi:hypothetical protein
MFNHIFAEIICKLFSALLRKTCHSFQYRQAALKRIPAYFPFTGVRDLSLLIKKTEWVDVLVYY